MNDHVPAEEGKAATHEGEPSSPPSAEKLLRQLVHDLRNPLNVLAQASILLEQVDDLEAARTIHEMIGRQVQELTELLARVDKAR